MALGMLMGKKAFRKSYTCILARVDVWGLELNIFLLVFIFKLLNDSESVFILPKLIKIIGYF